MLVGPKKVGLNKNSDEILVASKFFVTLFLTFFEKFCHFCPIFFVELRKIYIINKLKTCFFAKTLDAFDRKLSPKCEFWQNNPENSVTCARNR